MLEERGASGSDIGVTGCVWAEELARGGFAVVYKAHQLEFDREVAVKLLNLEMVDDAYRARFQREVRSLGRLAGHPNIVTVYDAGFTDAGRPYILMGLETGGSLADQVSKQGALAPQDATAIGVKLAGALAAAHAAGILHRDVKPENVLMSAWGEPRLADFGIAQVHGMARTRTGSVTASIVHVAPEILSGDKPSAEADIYSLASTVFQLLSGKPAFVTGAPDDTLPSIITRIVTASVPDLRPAVPEAICHVIERGMSKEPSMRQPTALAFGRELQDAQRESGLIPTDLAPPGGTDDSRSIPITRPVPPGPVPEVEVPIRRPQPDLDRPSQQAIGPRAPGPPESPGPRRPLPDQPGIAATRARVILTPAQVAVEPGAEAIITVRVRNLTSVVAEFTLRLIGAVTAYGELEPAVLHLFPDEEGSATVRFKPRRAPHIPPGPVPFGVQVAMTGVSPNSITEEGQLLIGAFSAIDAHLVPRQSSGRLRGKHRLRIENTGNAAATARVRATDPDEALRFRIRREVVQVEPGTKATAKIKARPSRVRLAGGTKPRDFTLEVASGEGPSLTVNGMFTQRPLFAPWMLPVALMLVAAIIVVTVFAKRTPASSAGGGMASGSLTSTTQTTASTTDSASTSSSSTSSTVASSSSGTTTTTSSTRSTTTSSTRTSTSSGVNGPPPPFPQATVPLAYWHSAFLHDVVIIRNAGVEQTVATGFDPVWSPSGTQLAYLDTSAGPTQLKVGTLSGSSLTGVTTLVANCSSCQGLAWSPDGTRLSYIDAAGNLVLVAKDGSNLHTVVAAAVPSVNGAVQTGVTAWTPNATRIVYGNPSGVFQVSPDGTNVKKIVTASNVEAISFKPDGTQFLFTSNMGCDSSHSSIIAIWTDGNLSIGPSRQLVSCGSNHYGDWDRSGRYVYFSQLVTGASYEIFRLDTTSGTLDKITSSSSAGGSSCPSLGCFFLLPQTNNQPSA